MSTQDDNDIIAKLSKLQKQIDTLRSVTKTRREEVKHLRGDVDKNKEALGALLKNTIFNFAMKVTTEEAEENFYQCGFLQYKRKFFLH